MKPTLIIGRANGNRPADTVIDGKRPTATPYSHFDERMGTAAVTVFDEVNPGKRHYPLLISLIMVNLYPLRISRCRQRDLDDLKDKATAQYRNQMFYKYAFGCVCFIAEGMRLSRLSGWKEKQRVKTDSGEERQKRVDKRDAYGGEEMERGIKGGAFY